MKLYFAVFIACLSFVCITKTLGYAIQDEVDNELIQMVYESLLKEIDEEIGNQNFKNSEGKREFRFSEDSRGTFVGKVADLVKAAKKCWKELRAKQGDLSEIEEQFK
uniref:Zodarin 3b n=1 Tax=Zodarion styliferum TaxID=1089303 RepID=A0A8D8EQ02_9ARAC|nr:Zodarin 3b precursor [Zodarion styliferum]